MHGCTASRQTSANATAWFAAALHAPGTDNTAAAVAQPSSYAISYISSTGSRPETPGGSTITDAIRAEIARGSTGTQPPSAAAATTVPPAGGYASGLRPAGAAGTTGDAVAGGTTGDTLRPLGGTASDEGDEFVDARSEVGNASTLASQSGQFRYKSCTAYHAAILLDGGFAGCTNLLLVRPPSRKAAQYAVPVQQHCTVLVLPM